MRLRVILEDRFGIMAVSRRKRKPVGARAVETVSTRLGDRSKARAGRIRGVGCHKTARFKTSALRAVVEGLILRLNLA